MIDLQAEIQNLKSFKKAMGMSESIVARGMWHGTSASLGAYRREFIKDTPVKMKSRGKANPRKLPPPNAASRMGMARRFRFQVKPASAPNVRFGIQQSAGVKTLQDVSGDLFTQSTAAFGLETGPTIRPDNGKWLGIPIVIPGNENAQSTSAGSRPRAKRSWNKVDKILKKSGYTFAFKKKGNKRIMYAQRKAITRGKRKGTPAGRPFPVMLLTPRVKIDPQLGFLSGWERFRGEVLMRYDREIKKALRTLTKQMNRRQ